MIDLCSDILENRCNRCLSLKKLNSSPNSTRILLKLGVNCLFYVCAFYFVKGCLELQKLRFGVVNSLWLLALRARGIISTSVDLCARGALGCLLVAAILVFLLFSCKTVFTVEVDPGCDSDTWKWKSGSWGQLPVGSLDVGPPAPPHHH